MTHQTLVNPWQEAIELRIQRCRELAEVHDRLAASHGDTDSGRQHLLMASARRDCAVELESDIKRILTGQEGASPIDNGNTFVFCDFVRDGMGCVRGAGHNGPHALSLPPHPQGPVLLEEVVQCEACESGYRLASSGIHYNDARDGATWGVCRKVVAQIRQEGASPSPRNEVGEYGDLLRRLDAILDNRTGPQHWPLAALLLQDIRAYLRQEGSPQ